MGLGDGCIYLVLAESLARSGYAVTVYSNHLGSLNDWFSAFETKYLPKPEETFSSLAGHDLVISDLGSMLTRHAVDAEQLGRRFVFVATCKVDPRFVHQAASETLAKLSPEKFAALAPLAAAAGSLRCIADDRISMVEQALSFCRTRFGLAHAVSEISLAPPEHLQFRRFAKRIMIHPLSFNTKKNWPAAYYLRLAHRLRRHGFDPQFVLSPKEREQHEAVFCGEFSVPHCADAGELAAYLYESGYVIGNDSGVGHLASLLGIPVLTLYRKRRDGFCWRPGWGTCEVVRPVISPGLAREHWSLFLSVSRVERAFNRLYERFEGSIL